MLVWPGRITTWFARSEAGRAGRLVLWVASARHPERKGEAGRLDDPVGFPIQPGIEIAGGQTEHASLRLDGDKPVEGFAAPSVCTPLLRRSGGAPKHKGGWRGRVRECDGSSRCVVILQSARWVFRKPVAPPKRRDYPHRAHLLAEFPIRRPKRRCARVKACRTQDEQNAREPNQFKLEQAVDFVTRRAATLGVSVGKHDAAGGRYHLAPGVI